MWRPWAGDSRVEIVAKIFGAVVDIFLLIQETGTSRLEGASGLTRGAIQRNKKHSSSPFLNCVHIALACMQTVLAEELSSNNMLPAKLDSVA